MNGLTKTRSDLAQLDRRGFLRSSASGLSLLAAAAALPACTGDVPPLPKLNGDDWLFFDPLSHSVLAAAADAIVYGKHSLNKQLPWPSDTNMLFYLDRMLYDMSADMQGQIRLLARAIEYGSMIFGLTFSRFSNLPIEKRQAILEDWMQSSIGLRRVAGNAVKMLTMAFYWTETATFAHLAYDGPLLERADIPYFEMRPMLLQDEDVLPALPQAAVTGQPK